MELDFGPYREQMKKLQMSPEAAERIRTRILEECGKHSEVRYFKHIVPSQLKKTRLMHAMAACLIIVLCVTCTTFSSLDLKNTQTQRANAQDLIRPSIRLEIKPTYGIAPTSRGVAALLDMRIVDPELTNEEVMISLAPEVEGELVPEWEDVNIVIQDEALDCTILTNDAPSNCFTLIAYNALSQEDYNNVCLDSETQNDTTGYFLGKALDKLRDLTFIVSLKEKVLHYSIDLSQFPDGLKISAYSNLHSYYPYIVFNLIKEV